MNSFSQEEELLPKFHSCRRSQNLVFLTLILLVANFQHFAEDMVFFFWPKALIWKSQSVDFAEIIVDLWLDVLRCPVLCSCPAELTLLQTFLLSPSLQLPLRSLSGHTVSSTQGKERVQLLDPTLPSDTGTEVKVGINESSSDPCGSYLQDLRCSHPSGCWFRPKLRAVAPAPLTAGANRRLQQIILVSSPWTWPTSALDQCQHCTVAVVRRTVMGHRVRKQKTTYNVYFFLFLKLLYLIFYLWFLAVL